MSVFPFVSACDERVVERAASRCERPAGTCGRCARCPVVSGAGRRQVAVRLRQSRGVARPLPPGRGQRVPPVICGGLARHGIACQCSAVSRATI